MNGVILALNPGMTGRYAILLDRAGPVRAYRNLGAGSLPG